VLANDAIDLDVAAGIVFGLLGPNGARKTTLVRQLTGELAPSSGTLMALGLDVVRETMAVKRLMGTVPQEADVFMALTTEEHMRLFSRLRGWTERKLPSARRNCSTSSGGRSTAGNWRASYPAD
jgi:ABC-2 type transport system ATP-binding protein